MPAAQGWSFLLRPRWILSHLLVILLVVLMINLGFWQLRRLDQRRDLNALIEGRRAEATVPVEDLLAPDDDQEAVDRVRYRTVSVTGTYDDDATVEVRNRSQDGVPGVYLLTPLHLANGDRVGVIRGFVGFDESGEPHEAPAPEGDVTVTGLIMRTRSFDGTAPRDINRLLDQADVLPAVVVAEDSEPPEPAAADDLIVAVPPPELTEGPHLSYALQWFIFSTIAVVGYPLVLRRVMQRRGKEVDDTDDLDQELQDLLRQS